MSSFNNLMIGPPFLGNGLVLWTKMDEGQGSIAFDTSGKNNHGTLVSSPTWATGKKGKCLSFSGSSQYVQINDNTSLNFTANKFTISLLVNFAAFPANGFQTWMFWKGTTNGSAPGYCFNIKNNNGTIQFDFPKFGIADQLGNWALLSTLSTNTWYHLVAVQNFNGATPTTVSFYVNGVLVSTSGNNSSAYSAPTGQPAYIGGATTYAGATNIHGMIDDVRAYNRALSATEISLLYNSYL